MNKKSISLFAASASLMAAVMLTVPAFASAAGEMPLATSTIPSGVSIATTLPTPNLAPPAFRAAYDLEAIQRYLHPKQDAPDVDSVQTAAITRSVFRSVAIPIRNFPVSNRWAPVYRAIKGCVGNACADKSGEFSRIVASAKRGGFVEKLNVVNRSVNQLIAYKRDSVVHGELDYWAKPAEILKRRAGDCEDFAILKMAALADAGVPMRSMSLVVLQDREKNVFHAILSVATGSGIFILDNVRDTVLKDTSLPSYAPLYSFSTDRAWIHGSKPGSAQIASADGGFDAIAPGEGPEEMALKPVKREGWMPRVAK